MKKSSRILAMLLAVSMLAALLCVPAAAEGVAEDPYASLKTGTGVLMFGDSITRGYAASDKWDDEGYTIDDTNNHNCRNVTGSYPRVLADMLGLYSPDDMTEKTATCWPLSKDAVTTAYLLDLFGIDDGFYDEEYLYSYGSMIKRYQADLYYFGDENSFDLEGNRSGQQSCAAISASNLVKNSSLITIMIGMGDIFNRARSLAFDEFLEHGDMSDTEALIGVLWDFVERMYEGFDYWQAHFPVLLDYFNENKRDDAMVIVLGAINPLFGVTVTEDIPVPIGTIMSAITMAMNQLYKQWAEERGFIFLDVSNVDTGTTVYGENIIDFVSAGSREQGIATHPTPEGYKQIARMIKNALDEELAKRAEEAPAVPNTFIQVDLGQFEKVNYVKVNGRDISNFSVEDHVLTIPYFTPFAKNFAVEIVNEDGSVALIAYDLEYDLAEGYTAHRAYQTNDLVGTLTQTLKLIVDAIISLVKNVVASLKQ